MCIQDTTALQNADKPIHCSNNFNFDFLALPFELRERIYILLFEQGLILYNQKLAVTRQRRQRLVINTPQNKSNSMPTFSPTNRQKNLFAILLTCRQCYHEGLVLYYRHTTVKGLLAIHPAWLSVSLPYHALNENFQIPEWPQSSSSIWQRANTRVGVATVPSGLTSNLAMVLEHSRYFADDCSLPWFSNLRHARALCMVEYQIVDQFRADDRSIRHITLFRRQSIERWELSSSYLWRYLPRNRLGNRTLTKDLREQVFGQRYDKTFGDAKHPEASLAMLEEMLVEKPNVEFILTCPVVYLVDGQRCCAICDFDLCTEELVSKRLVIEDSMYNVGYFRMEEYD